METVLRQIREETTTWGKGDDVKWRARYKSLYDDFPTDVKVVRDISYGPHERNILDVYVPKESSPQKPVVVYVHGGGFFSGDKAWSDKNYANVGCYYAKQGIVTVVISHRLVPHVQYPGGGEDIRAAREWIFNNIASEEYGNGSPEKVVLLGHSSGGAHIATDLYSAGDPSLPAKEPLHPPVAGVIYISVPFWFDPKNPTRMQMLRDYFGSDANDVWQPKTALGLFRQLPKNSPVLDSTKLPTYVGIVEWEIKPTADGNIWFLDAYRAKSKPAGTLPTFHVLKGHNHISNMLSIGTSDTAQAEHLLEFIRACVG
ncbi:hypothetical protein M409DRAFT_28157 [Zasmidium cellare ATCC 36951]|uniref:BD-FAE-like domain-containing protein n=1 Tax=Zasmidium cellare ATCC 36951 TaxID=1080233 RepID=A0A6A6C7Q9_ZASCE|nr:uncharacterized protein M409DRAFT_28157 [Zasmidium cellare ATCC 36951]KAF2161426.1 hypothetical protein M409DRAFT_28157 [Zasmidium cellare ATCC 36951]